jgi:hypothetical protein
MAGNPTRKAAMASALYKNRLIVSAANYSNEGLKRIGEESFFAGRVFI